MCVIQEALHSGLLVETNMLNIHTLSITAATAWQWNCFRTDGGMQLQMQLVSVLFGTKKNGLSPGSPFSINIFSRASIGAPYREPKLVFGSVSLHFYFLSPPPLAICLSPSMKGSHCVLCNPANLQYDSEVNLTLGANVFSIRGHALYYLRQEARIIFPC